MKTFTLRRKDFTDEFDDGGMWAAILDRFDIKDGEANDWDSVAEIEVQLNVTEVVRETGEVEKVA